MNRLLRMASLAAMLFFNTYVYACQPECAGTLAYQAYGNTENPKSIVVFMHGAVSSGGPADYMYSYARRFAINHPDVVAIALLGPGYFDRDGKRSQGSDANRRLADDTDPIIGALEYFSTQYKTQKIYVLGHSKGAMNMAGILGKKPGLITGAVLVAGVYDLHALAAYRNRGQSGIQGIDLVSKISKETKIVLVHGDADRDVPIAQSIAYDKKARNAGLSSQLITLQGQGHNFSGQVSKSAIEQLVLLIQ